MGKNVLVLGVVLLFLLLLLGGVSSAPTASSPAKIVGGFLSNALSALMKWLWSLKANNRTAITSKTMVTFESGYTVETVFDGSKLGIEPHTVEVLPSGELLILDSANSNLYRISASLSLYNRPRLLAGSPEGYPGHVDGKHREARMNHPKGVAVDDRGNIYIADTMNMAIRKISDAGVTTIAGGKWTQGGGHADGPSEDAKFSNDFDVVYVGSSCSLLVIDRGNRAIKEIQLHFDDCAYQYGSGFPLGIGVLVAAGFFGYMLGLLQRRVGTIVSSQNDRGFVNVNAAVSSPYQTPLKLVRLPLIPNEDEQVKQEGFFGSLGMLFVNGGVCVSEIFGGLFPGFRKKPLSYQYHQIQHQQQQKHSMHWPSQETFVIPDDDEPPSIDTRTPTPRKTYPFMSKDAEKIHQMRQSLLFYSGWDSNMHQQQLCYQSSTPHTYHEQSHEKTNDIVFGAVQEQNRKHESIVTKPVYYGDNMYDPHNNIRFRSNYSG
ncbi:hypothetical protein V6N13_090375 [Hibiscus sabdariffa]|uniref:NHL repeat-containing protein n=1 Tax=Hibiscus sabdariffa TaxID=183260 RepID=A0ABR2C0H5_9ROSI